VHHSERSSDFFPIMHAFVPLTLFAQAAVPADWHPTTLAQAMVYTVLFSLVGIFMAILGYKLFDWATPGELHEEIIKNRNVAAALIGAAVIVGTCIIIAAAIVG
jgi:amino acid transporter